MPILTPTYSTKFLIDWTTMPEILNLVYDSLCLTDIQFARDLIVDISISSSISLPGKFSLLVHNIGSPWLTLNHMVATFLMLYYREGPEISTPSHGGTNPTLDSCHPTTYHRRYLKATFIITQLRSDVWCPQSIPPVNGSDIISWSKETILGILKVLAIKLLWHDQLQLFIIGSCPSHHYS